MLNRIKHLVETGEDFAFETTLATKSYVSFIQKAKERGFKVTLIFVYLNSVELAKQRVKHRVSKGGHHIEAEVIERRYHAGLKNFLHLYMPVSDDWLVFDNSLDLNIIAQGNSNISIEKSIEILYLFKLILIYIIDNKDTMKSSYNKGFELDLLM